MRVHIFFHAGAEQKRSANQRSLGQHLQGLQRLRYGTHHRLRQIDGQQRLQYAERRLKKGHERVSPAVRTHVFQPINQVVAERISGF